MNRLPALAMSWILSHVGGNGGGIWILALVYTAAQAYVSAHQLRPPYRAARAGWDYTYGFYGLEEHPELGRFRWTRKKAVVVLPVRGPVLQLTMFVHHPDVAERPVRVRVWIFNDRVADVTFRDHRPVTVRVPMPREHERIALTIKVSRTWRPADYGRSDTRELGVGIADWTFVDGRLRGPFPK